MPFGLLRRCFDRNDPVHFERGRAGGPVVPVQNCVEQADVSVFSIAQHDKLFDHVPQFADISRPRIFRKDLKSFVRELNVAPVFFVVGVQKVDGQRGDVRGSFPQRRDFDIDNIDPVIEVIPEFSLCNHFFQIPVCRGQNMRVDFHRLGGPDPGHLLCFQHAQKLYLHVKLQLPNFVQQNGSIARRFEKALFPQPVRSGESASYIAEQLRFHQRVRNGSAVDGHERICLSGAVVVNISGDHFFSGPGFAEDQYGDIGIADLQACFQNFFHVRAGGDGAVFRRFLKSSQAFQVQFLQFLGLLQLTFQSGQLRHILYVNHNVLNVAVFIKDRVAGSHENL